jgi:GNAT superfamily N-acetyltransferase
MTHLVYRLLPHDYGRYRKHLHSLDSHSKYLRFGHHIQPEALDQLCDKFEDSPQLHKIFVIENDDLDVVAAGHVGFDYDRSVELAFSVLKEHQGQGMGSKLMATCVEWCQNRGIKTGCMVCLKSNEAIKKLAKKHGIMINDGSEVLADIKIPDANAVSVINEVLGDNLSKFDHLGKLQRKFAKMLTMPLQFTKRDI